MRKPKSNVEDLVVAEATAFATRERLRGGARHFIAGIEVDPAPEGWLEALGAVTIALVCSVVPDWLWFRLGLDRAFEVRK